MTGRVDGSMSPVMDRETTLSDVKQEAPQQRIDEPRHRVDAAHPTCKFHWYTPSGGIRAEYWIFIDVENPGQLDRAAGLVLEHLHDWRTFYRRSHIEFIGPEPEPYANTPVMFRFAPLALWGKKFTGHEFTNLTVSFSCRERLPGENGWVIKGELIDGYDESGKRLPHEFIGPVRTEVRIINEPAVGNRPARVGIEVRDIWVDVENHKRVPTFMATRIHLFRSADGFGGLRKVVKKELKHR